MNSPSPLKILIVNSFEIKTSDDVDLTPSGPMLCALLSMLVLAPDYRQSRTQLRETLWPDRSREQGIQSLRNALAQIRRTFGAMSHVLLTDRQSVALRADEVVVDIDDYQSESSASQPVLVRGIDIRSSNFKLWLNEQQRLFNDRQSSSVASSPIVQVSRWRPWVRIKPINLISNQQTDQRIGSLIQHLLGQQIADTELIDVCDDVRDTPGLEIEIDAVPTNQTLLLQLRIYTSHDRQLLWSGDQPVPRSISGFITSSRTAQWINQIVDVASMQLRYHVSDRDDEQAFRLGYDAMRHMFRISTDELVTADSLLAQAQERFSDGRFHAWRAYLQSFYIGEHHVDRKEVSERALAYSQYAIEQAPHNSTVLALASYVHSFTRRDFHTGHELAERSLQLNQHNPMARAFLGRAKSSLGQQKEGYRLARSARELCGPTPYRYTLDFIAGITALGAGEMDDAMHMGEFARLTAPTYKAPLRYLVLLYLKSGQTELAHRAMTDLRALEPNFSLRMLREQQYPSHGLVEAGLLAYADSALLENHPD